MSGPGFNWKKVSKARGLDKPRKMRGCPTWSTNCKRKLQIGFDKLKRKIDFDINLKKPNLQFSTSEISVEKQLRNKNIGDGASSDIPPKPDLNIEENLPKDPITGRNDAALAQFFKYKT